MRWAHFLAPRYDGQDRARFDRLAALAADLGIGTVASASPLMHHGRRRRLAQLLRHVSGERAQPRWSRRARFESR